MNLQMFLVLVVTVIVFFGFVRERHSPDATAFLGVSLLLVIGALSPGDFLGVFSNSAPITIAAMFILSKALENTGVIAGLGEFAARVVGGSWLQAMLVLLIPVMILSAVVNNTPVVVVLTPVVIALARQQQNRPSKYLIPLSFASVLGGTCTLLGTSTNILVDSIYQEHGFAPFGIFEISGVGLMLAGTGLAYMLLFGWWLLPERPTPGFHALAGQRRFLTEVVIPVDSPLVDKPVRTTMLNRHRILEIHRDGFVIRSRPHSAVLRAGDRLVIESDRDELFTLRADRSVEMGDTQPSDFETLSQREMHVAEAIVGPEARIIGMSVADLNLERRFGVYVLGVHRHKKRLKRGFQHLRLQVGDMLLLQGTTRSLAQLYNNRSFVNVSVPAARPLQRAKAPIAIISILAVVALAALNVMPIAPLAVIFATITVLTRCLSSGEAYEAIQWPVIMLIFAMLAIGVALENTGAMEWLVNALLAVSGELGPLGLLALLYIVTSVSTEVMSNNAAAILMTPVAIGLAASAGLDPRPFVVAVMLAGSASFATPIGYQTNTFVYQAGGYRFTDFVRIGVPMNLLALAVSVWGIPLFWPLVPNG
ncbi:MAG: SLC13 family permease [Xanthomonadales bacterium]|nr:SLC13 family permease [Xanthomonadales bacterium]